MEDTIHDMIYNNNIEEIKSMLKNGTDINEKDDEFGATPLHRAITRGHNEIALFLIEQGADTTLQDKEGYTPLHYTAEYGNIIVAKAILEKNTASLHMENKYCERPLYRAVRNAKKEPFPMVTLFLEKGADKTHGTVLEWVKIYNINELTKLFERY